MATSVELAAKLGCTEQTVRNWSRRFSDHLSGGATQAGEVRDYTEEDAAVLLTVATLRKQNKSFADIGALLAKGYRVGEEAGQNEAKSADEEATETGLSIQQMTVMIGELQGKVTTLREEHERLWEELKEERDARLEAEKALARLEGRLEALQAPPEEKVTATAVEEQAGPQQTVEQPERPPWWQRLLGRR